LINELLTFGNIVYFAAKSFPEIHERLTK